MDERGNLRGKPNYSTRRRILKVIGIGTATGLAGCTGGDGGDDDGGDGGDDGADGDDDDGTTNSGTDDNSTDSGDEDDGQGGDYPQEEMGSVTNNTLEGLEVVGWTSEIGEDGDVLFITLAIRNGGDQEAVPRKYGYHVTLYDDSGAELLSSYQEASSAPDRNIESGETDEIILTYDPENPEAVARYEIDLNCDTALANGVYCP